MTTREERRPRPGALDLWQGGAGHVFGSRHPARSVAEPGLDLVGAALGPARPEQRLRAEISLLAVAGPNASRATFYSGSASIAAERAVAAARKRSGKSVVFALANGEHGETCEALRMSGAHLWSGDRERRRACFLPDPLCGSCPYGRTPQDCEVECLADLEYLYDAHFGDVAAVILEPATCRSGFRLPPDRYFARLRDFCDAHDVALIFDEAGCGLGWLGSARARDTFGVEPDLSVHGPALGGGPALCALVGYGKIGTLDCDAPDGPAPAQLSLMLATDALEKLRDSAIGAMARCISGQMEHVGRSAAPGRPGSVNGRGLMWAIAPADSARETAGQVVEALGRDNIQVGFSKTLPAHILLRIPVTLTQHELKRVVAALEKSMSPRDGGRA